MGKKQIEKNKLRKSIKRKMNKINRKLNKNKPVNNNVINDNKYTNNVEKFKEFVNINNNELYIEYEKKIRENIESNIKENIIIQENKSIISDDKTLNSVQIPSKKKKKDQERMSLAQLKVISERPDLIKNIDTTAKDPLTLIYLKSYKNTVPVPENWDSKKNSYFQTEKYNRKIFKLPAHIENTGISKFRDPMIEKDQIKMLKQKIKERMNPRLNKIDLDYEVLYDAFFKENFLPHFTKHGDLYYNGKEDDNKIKNLKPGILSIDLRNALGISENGLPPWIHNMKKFGTPPSYPNYKLPGFENFKEYKNLILKNKNKNINKLLNNLVGGEENVNNLEDSNINKDIYWGILN